MIQHYYCKEKLDDGHSYSCNLQELTMMFTVNVSKALKLTLLAFRVQPFLRQNENIWLIGRFYARDVKVV